MNSVHSTVIEIDGIGVMLVGETGSGKSLHAYNLIRNYGAKLVVDDYVELEKIEEKVIAKRHDTLKDLIEVRNVGIVKSPSIEKTEIKLVINLVREEKDTERLPDYDCFKLCDVECPKINLFWHDSFIYLKILAAIDVINKKTDLYRGFLIKK